MDDDENVIELCNYSANDSAFFCTYISQCCSFAQWTAHKCPFVIARDPMTLSQRFVSSEPVRFMTSGCEWFDMSDVFSCRVIHFKFAFVAGVGILFKLWHFPFSLFRACRRLERLFVMLDCSNNAQRALQFHLLFLSLYNGCAKSLLTLYRRHEAGWMRLRQYVRICHVVEQKKNHKQFEIMHSRKMELLQRSLKIGISWLLLNSIYLGEIWFMTIPFCQTLLQRWSGLLQSDEERFVGEEWLNNLVGCFSGGANKSRRGAIKL